MTAALGLSTAAATAAVAAFGVFGRALGEPRTVTSPRGETYSMITGGPYAYNAERVVAEGVGWDLFTLFFAVPTMAAAALLLLRRDSARARLVLFGLFVYVFYQYFMYALTWAFGPLLPAFVGLALLALAGVGASVSSFADPHRRPVFGPRFPRRSMAALCFTVGLLLVVMWSHRIARGLGGTAELLGQTTMVVQVLDLVLVVPLAGVTAVLVLRRRPTGPVLATVFAVKAVAMACAICAMLVVAARVEGHLETVPFAVFAVVACLASALAVKMLAAVSAPPLTTSARPS